MLNTTDWCACSPDCYQRGEDNDVIYLPLDFILRRYIFFAVDNVDFSEDTPDGKRTLYGTAMAIYQRGLMMEMKSQSWSWRNHTVNAPWKSCPAQSQCYFIVPSQQLSHQPSLALRSGEAAAQVTEASLPDATWRSKVKVSPGTTRSEEQPDDNDNSQENIPTWSGYHSLVSQKSLTTRVGTLPLLCLLLQHMNGKRCWPS